MKSGKTIVLSTSFILFCLSFSQGHTYQGPLKAAKVYSPPKGGALSQRGLPQIDTITTGIISLAVTNKLQYGLGGGGGVSGVRMDFWNYPLECDTVDTIPGETKFYLWDGSYIIGGIVNGDTILSNQIFDGESDIENKIYPLTVNTPPTIDGIVGYWRSGTLTNHDTTLGIEISYYAPQMSGVWGTQVGKTWYADQQFITTEFKIWSMNGQLHEGLVAGEVIDWDIPSDSNFHNNRQYDVPNRLLYTYGAEYNQDNAVECQENSNRFGGMAFGYYKRYSSALGKWTIIDSVGYGGYHAHNSDYVIHGWEDNELYANMEAFPWAFWFVPFTDTLSRDNHSVLTYAFDIDLEPDDTLIFYAVKASVRNSAEEWPLPTRTNARVKDLAAKGRNFTRYFGCCRGTRGDANGDGVDCNILDLTFMVDRVFRGGPVPTCLGEADANSDKSPGDVLDLTFMVDRIFRNGPAPLSCGTPPF